MTFNSNVLMLKPEMGKLKSKQWWAILFFTAKIRVYHSIYLFLTKRGNRVQPYLGVVCAMVHYYP
ncbi:hypothetical protein Noda2021_01450 [Candidatus Dependentiae bacterium Noda2021]|nr:hypothetical protein Noda2021_01450 [Candidatus Dependentiae bacterium Noda2021]